MTPFEFDEEYQDSVKEAKELYNSSKNETTLKNYIKALTASNRRTLDLKMNPSEARLLLCMDDNNNSILENLVKKAMHFDSITLNSIVNDPELLKIVVTKSNDLVDMYLSPDIYTKKIDGKVVIQYLLENGILTDEGLKKAGKLDDDIIMYLYNTNPMLLLDLSNDCLFEQEINGEKIIEFLIRKYNHLDDIFANVDSMQRVEILIDLAKKYDKEYLLSTMNQKFLPYKYKGDYLYKYIENLGLPIIMELSDLNLMKVLFDNGDYEYFEKMFSDDKLLEKYDENTTFLEALIKRGYIPDVQCYDEKSLKILSDYNCYEKMLSFPLSDLLKNRNLSETYLEQLIQAYKEGKISYIYVSPRAKLDYLIKAICLLYDNGASDLIPDLSDVLLKKNDGTTLLDELIKIDRLDVVPKNNLGDFEVGIYLRLKGIDYYDINIELFSTDVIDKYVSKYNDSEFDVEENEDLETIHDKFRFFFQDSDSKFVELLYQSYAHYLKINPEEARNEITKLFRILIAHPEFMILESSKSYFSSCSCCIGMDTDSINVLNHEIGHALYDFYSNEKYSEEFELLCSKLRNDSEFLKRVEQFSIQASKIKKTIDERIKELINKEHDKYCEEETKNKIMEFLESSKSNKLDELLKKGYSEETLSIVLGDVFSFDEYVSQDLTIKQNILRSALYECDYICYFAISDMIDAIMKGQYFDGDLKDEDNKKLICIGGHGKNYYNSEMTHSVDEVMANLSSILKSNSCEIGLAYIEEYIGKEFLDFIMNRYRNEIVYSNKKLDDYERSK